MEYGLQVDRGAPGGGGADAGGAGRAVRHRGARRSCWRVPAEAPAAWGCGRCRAPSCSGGPTASGTQLADASTGCLRARARRDACGSRRPGSRFSVFVNDMRAPAGSTTRTRRSPAGGVGLRTYRDRRPVRRRETRRHRSPTSTAAARRRGRRSAATGRCGTVRSPSRPARDGKALLKDRDDLRDFTSKPRSPSKPAATPGLIFRVEQGDAETRRLPGYYVGSPPARAGARTPRSRRRPGVVRRAGEDVELIPFWVGQTTCELFPVSAGGVRTRVRPRAEIPNRISSPQTAPHQSSVQAADHMVPENVDASARRRSMRRIGGSLIHRHGGRWVADLGLRPSRVFEGDVGAAPSLEKTRRSTG